MRTPAQTPSPQKNPTAAFPDFVDPAVHWTLGPGIDYFFLPWRQNKDWLPIVILLQGISLDDFKKASFVVTGTLVFSQLQPDGSSVHGEGEYYMASAHKDFFLKTLADKPLDELVSQHVREVWLGLPLDSMSLPPSAGGNKI